MTNKQMSRTILNHSCPVCNTEYGIILGKLSYVLFDNNSLYSEYDVVSCKNCGFVFCNTKSMQEDYNKFYKNYFYSSAYINRKIDEDEENYIGNIYYNILPYIHLTSKLIDIGCGNGLLLKKLKSLGFNNLYGVDLSESCVELLKKEGINAKQGSILDIPFDEKVDVIVLSHILEHIVDLKSTLKCLHNKLSDNGTIYVEVPDAYRYDQFIDYSPLRYFYLQHIVHFDKFHLRNLFENNGFIEIDCGNSTRIEGNLIMPCIWCTFKKSQSHNFNICNFTLSSEVKSWFDYYSLDDNNILKNIDLSKKNVFIWGLGIHMNMMLSMSPLKDCNIKYYVDSNERTQKETINNKKIHSTNILKEATKDDVIVIGAPTHFDGMYSYLKEINFEGTIIKCGFGNIELIQ